MTWLVLLYAFLIFIPIHLGLRLIVIAVLPAALLVQNHSAFAAAGKYQYFLILLIFLTTTLKFVLYVIVQEGVKLFPRWYRHWMRVPLLLGINLGFGFLPLFAIDLGILLSDFLPGFMILPYFAIAELLLILIGSYVRPNKRRLKADAAFAATLLCMVAVMHLWRGHLLDVAHKNLPSQKITIGILSDPGAPKPTIHPDLLVFPEGSGPGSLTDISRLNDLPLLKKWQNKHEKVLYTGLTISTDSVWHNSACLLSSNGKNPECYHKANLFPLVEWFPFYSGMQSGSERAVLNINNWKIAPLICYDSAFQNSFRWPDGTVYLESSNDVLWRGKQDWHSKASAYRARQFGACYIRALRSGKVEFFAQGCSITVLHQEKGFHVLSVSR